ncbi:hypothetical protein RI367_003237 [Sorochytrium milnesiophthora]
MTDGSVAAIPTIVPGQQTLLKWDPARASLGNLNLGDLYLCGARVPDSCQLIVSKVPMRGGSVLWTVPSNVAPSVANSPLSPSQILVVPAAESLVKATDYVMMGRVTITEPVTGNAQSQVTLGALPPSPVSGTPASSTLAATPSPTATGTPTQIVLPVEGEVHSSDSRALSTVPMTALTISVLVMGALASVAVLFWLVMWWFKRRQHRKATLLPTSSARSHHIATVTSPPQSPSDDGGKLSSKIARLTVVAVLRSRLGSNMSDSPLSPRTYGAGSRPHTQTLTSPRRPHRSSTSNSDAQSANTFYPWDPRDNDPVPTWLTTEPQQRPPSCDLGSETSMDSNEYSIEYTGRNADDADHDEEEDISVPHAHRLSTRSSKSLAKNAELLRCAFGQVPAAVNTYITRYASTAQRPASGNLSLPSIQRIVTVIEPATELVAVAVEQEVTVPPKSILVKNRTSIGTGSPAGQQSNVVPAASLRRISFASDHRRPPMPIESALQVETAEPLPSPSSPSTAGATEHVSLSTVSSTTTHTSGTNTSSPYRPLQRHSLRSDYYSARSFMSDMSCESFSESRIDRCDSHEDFDAEATCNLSGNSSTSYPAMSQPNSPG